MQRVFSVKIKNTLSAVVLLIMEYNFKELSVVLGVIRNYLFVRGITCL